MLARNWERAVPKIQKPLRGDAKIICTEGRKFSKSRPQEGPSKKASEKIIGSGADEIP
jgi:hypothetical protein